MDGCYLSIVVDDSVGVGADGLAGQSCRCSAMTSSHRKRLVVDFFLTFRSDEDVRSSSRTRCKLIIVFTGRMLSFSGQSCSLLSEKSRIRKPVSMPCTTLGGRISPCQIPSRCKAKNNSKTYILSRHHLLATGERISESKKLSLVRLIEVSPFLKRLPVKFKDKHLHIFSRKSSIEPRSYRRGS